MKTILSYDNVPVKVPNKVADIFKSAALNNWVVTQEDINTIRRFKSMSVVKADIQPADDGKGMEQMYHIDSNNAPDETLENLFVRLV